MILLTPEEAMMLKILVTLMTPVALGVGLASLSSQLLVEVRFS